MVTILCSYIVQSANGLWFALGWPTALMPFSIIATFIVTMKRTGLILCNRTSVEPTSSQLSGPQGITSVIAKIDFQKKTSKSRAVIFTLANFKCISMKCMQIVSVAWQHQNNSSKGEQHSIVSAASSSTKNTPRLAVLKKNTKSTGPTVHKPRKLQKRAASTKASYSRKSELHSMAQRQPSVQFMSSQFLSYFE